MSSLLHRHFLWENPPPPKKNPQKKTGREKKGKKKEKAKASICPYRVRGLKSSLLMLSVKGANHPLLHLQGHQGHRNKVLQVGSELRGHRMWQGHTVGHSCPLTSSGQGCPSAVQNRADKSTDRWGLVLSRPCDSVAVTVTFHVGSSEPFPLTDVLTPGDDGLLH